MNKRMKKRGLAFCLAFLLVILIYPNCHIVSATQADDAGSSSSTIQEVRESVVVVAIWAELENGKDMSIQWGSGFFLACEGSDVQHLVTNHHVIQNFLKNGAGEAVDNIRIVIEENGKEDVYNLGPGRMKIRAYFDSKNYEEAYVVAHKKIKDLAVLKLDVATTERKGLVLCSPTDNMVGNRVYVVGYPGLSENKFTGAVSRWKVSDSSVVDGSLSRLLTGEGTGVRRLQTNAPMQAGNSGGPLVNENGQVLGINYMAVYTGDVTETNNYAINVDELIPILDKNNIKYELAGAESAKPAEPEPKPIIPDPPTPDPINTKILIAALAAAVILVILLLIVILTKKKQPQTPTNVSPSAPQTGMGGSPAICSLSEQHNGAHFPLNGSQILIGRDVATCAVVFREGTPGVSSRHCSVSYEPASGDFILTDLRSSYGTFLANGQQLTPGLPYRLKEGQEFYLGGRANLLRVEISR